jgi:hypothetical protein
LETPISLNFQQPTRLVTILQRLGEAGDARIVVHWRDLAGAEWNPDADATLLADNQPLGEALDALLAPLDLAWRIVDGRTIEVVTRERLARHPELEVYPVGDLVADDPEGERLIANVVEKLYVLDMFPYPSGAGLHVGHPEGYTATDIVCRYERMRGKSVLHPMGFDAFGLPAEEHAIKTNTPRGQRPKRTSPLPPAAEDARLQLRLGPRAGHDRRRLLPLDAVDLPGAVRHVVRRRAARRAGRSPSCRFPPTVSSRAIDAVRRYQDEHRLAYQSDAPVNWCPALGTVLANEEVIDGKSERGGHPVVRMPLRQWMLRITAYADRLEKDLEPLDWSERSRSCSGTGSAAAPGRRSIFIGGMRARRHVPRPQASTGLRKRGKQGSISGFPAKPGDDVLRIYTTRPDTLFGATYMVIAPEHPLVDRADDAEAASGGRGLLRKGRAQERPRAQELAEEKTGVFTGATRSTRSTASRPDLDRRLRADQLRHRGDHGRAGARRARLRVRQAVRPADRAGRRSGDVASRRARARG